MWSSPPFIWALIGILLIASELLIPGFVIFFFGAGALLTALLSWLVPGISGSVGLQGILWAASSVLFLSFLRRHFSRIFRGQEISLVHDEHVGMKATVSEPIAPGAPGRVRYQGTTWTARSDTESFEVGQTVQIIKEENLTLVVTAPFEE